MGEILYVPLVAAAHRAFHNAEKLKLEDARAERRDVLHHRLADGGVHHHAAGRLTAPRRS